MAAVGTTWVCERAVVVVVRDCGFGVNLDPRRYSETLILQHFNQLEMIGKLAITVDIAKHWTQVET